MADTETPRLAKPSLVAPIFDSTPGTSVANASTLLPFTGSCCEDLLSIVLPIVASVVLSAGGSDVTEIVADADPIVKDASCVTCAAASRIMLSLIKDANPSFDIWTS
jgi:hypothetical protein